MRNWQLTQPGILEFTNTESKDILSINDAKIRITKCLITKSDLDFKATEYPITIGNKAIGVVIETSQDSFLEKNDRVIFKSELPCQECEECLENNEKNCLQPKFAGEDFDGFLKDFSIKSINEIIKIPEKISDHDALFIPLIAKAINILDQLDLEKGQNVCIIGKGIISLILGQIMLYYQYVPILISEDEEFISKARECGFYYIFSNTKDITRNIQEITGNKMINKIVYVDTYEHCVPIIEKVASGKAQVIIIGSVVSTTPIDFHYFIKKQITINFIRGCGGKFDNAINLLTKDIIKLNSINLMEYKIEELSDPIDKLRESNKVFGIITNLISL